ncbi:MAG TPA: hypothetical protein VGR07_07950 [Thermoanaerobaculia bacterium]|nr:hypothetical protein [Thermoanaerobaculia bacterium]
MRTRTSQTVSPAADSLQGTGWLFPLAFLLAGGLFLAQGRIGFDLADEGFLWYGAVRTAHGGVPLADFYSYDPGRYLWAAGWARLLGDGILALRLSTAVFAALGLFLGLLAARRAVAGRGALLLVGVLLALWMFPRHKLFETSLTMAAVYMAVRLLERPTRRTWFAAGVATGLAAFFGKNHGLYWGLACLGLLLFLQLRGEGSEWGRSARHLLAWLAGIVAGSLPLLVMMLAIPGFFRAYLDSILFFLAQGRTNAPLPVPWPWRATGGGQLALGISFLFLPLVYLLTAVVVWRTDAQGLARRRLLVAAGFTGVFYLHHAFSRADAAHLGQSIHPALLAALALPLAWETRGRRLAAGLVAALLAGLTLGAALPESPLYRRLAGERRGVRYVPSDIAGDRLLLPADQAAGLMGIRSAVRARLAPAEPLLILPYYPGLYPFLGRTAPIWDTYAIWPAKGGSDERRLAELAARGVRWELAGDYDQPGWQGFRANHPALAGYLARRFAPVAAPELPPHFMLLERR